jgi:MFS family permease
LVVSVISSLGAPLIPTIADDLHASLSSTQWSLTATLLVGAVVSPLVGRLGDGPHRRTVLLTCLGLVTLGGAIAALAGTLPVLIAGRALQGIGLALLPLTMASARDELPPERAHATIATLSVIAAVGVGLGYPITGFIAEYADAAAAFWFGTLASAVAFVLAFFFVPPSTKEDDGTALDVRGAFLVGAGLLALLLALEKGTDWGWSAASTIGLLFAAVVLLAAWTAHELRVAVPLVELRLVRRRPVLTANVTGFVLGVSMYLGISLMTQVVQLGAGLHETVFVAGLTLVPLSFTSSFSSRMLPAIQRRIGPRATIPTGALVIAAAMLFFALTGSALWQAFVTMGLVGLGIGLTFAAMPGLIVGAVPATETSSAMSFYQVSRYVGFSVGSGLAVTLLLAFEGGGPPTADAYRSTFVVGAGLCALSAAIAWLLPGRALDHVADPPDNERAVREGELGGAGLPDLTSD